MANSEADQSRRRFLVAATSVVGAGGVVAVAAPFLSSMAPSARALAAGAPVEQDLSKVEPGQQISVKWQGKPVWIVNRTEQMLGDLPEMDTRLKDPDSVDGEQQPDYATNGHRSLKPEYLVVVGICTHLGCSPKYRPEVAPADLGADWRGGFYCACHGSRFDMAGRVYKNVPAGANLKVPKYHFIDDQTILIGESGGKA